ncbi:MAG: flavin reductase [Clostridia bacterium]|nr:flavin reductase [Clostridia bacterium]
MALDPTALFNISYGLYVLTSHDGKRDCGCISNSVMQLTSDPLRIAVSVNKQNHTCSAIQQSGIFNISILTESATMDVFRRFGFQSGRDVDKFAGSDEPASENGLRYLPQLSNALISGKVEQVIDCGTHLLFIASVTQADKLSAEPSMTYSYYFANVKPKPQPKQQEKRGWRCRICGYEYEGEELPPDFVCPLCKHGAEDFEPIGG